MNQNYNNTISISIFTGYDWIQDLYRDLRTYSMIVKSHTSTETVLELPDIVIQAFRESKYSFFGLDLITVWKWTEEITTTVYGGRDPEVEQNFTNCIVLLYWLLANHTQYNDVMVSMAIELPDIVHITFQR